MTHTCTRTRTQYIWIEPNRIVSPTFEQIPNNPCRCHSLSLPHSHWNEFAYLIWTFADKYIESRNEINEPNERNANWKITHRNYSKLYEFKYRLALSSIVIEFNEISTMQNGMRCDAMRLISLEMSLQTLILILIWIIE